MTTQEEGKNLAEEASKLEQAMKSKELGANLYKENKFIEAQSMWKKALELLPQNESGEPMDNLNRMVVALRLNLSQVAIQLVNHEETITQATAVLKLEPGSSKALYRRGIALNAQGKIKCAANDFKKAAQLEPRNGEIRRRYEECKKKVQDGVEEGPPVHDVPSLPRVFLDVKVGAAKPTRMVFALYTDSTPKTAENFRQLCTGEHAGLTLRGIPFHYKGCLLHRMIPGLMVQGGDFDNANGTGGESIYGRRFPDENFRDVHNRRGLLAMANNGPNTNGSNFFVSFAPAEHLDKRHVIFGELVKGWELLDLLETLPTNPEHRPLTDCVITDCGNLMEES